METLSYQGADMPAEFYTTEELAEYLKLSEQTIRLWIKQGKVKSYKFGRAHRIPIEEVQRFLEEARKESQQEVDDNK
ncbi:helix-turn-helix domain-containing protein [Herpetosiphon llansteffanensis]